MKNTSFAFFVDLDETMINSVYFGHKQPDFEDKKLVIRLKFGADTEAYQVKIHPETINLLEYLRSLTSHVFMLTVAIKSYAEEINSVFKLGFKKRDIFSREEIEVYDKRDLPEKLDAVDTIVLIDNLPYFDNQQKLAFLSNLGKGRQKYIKVNDFYSLRQNDHWTFDHIKKEIET